MVRHAAPTGFFWNCLGCSLVLTSIGISISVARTETMSLELARYKLKTGAALTKVQQEVKEAEQSTNTLTIDRREKQQLKQELRDVDRALVEAEKQIEQKVPLINNEDNN